MIYIHEQQIRIARLKHFLGLKKLVLKRIDHKPKYNTPSYIQRFLKQNLKRILIANPTELVEIYSDYNKTIRRKDKKAFNKFLKEVFKYEDFTNKKPNQYDAYDLAANLDIRVCPYCNRQYTITVLTGKLGKEHVTRPQFDHFFSQSDFPLLRLSFYNLIPSCAICNTTFKGKIEFKLNDYPHPYVDNLQGIYQFSYRPKNTASGIGHGFSLDIDINIDKSDADVARKVQGMLDVFRIKEIYNGHIDEVKELILLKRILSDNYLNILKNHTYPSLKITTKELYRLAFGVYHEEEYFNKRPFSKLKKDILKEIGII